MIPFRVLTGDQHPHFTVINEFRLRHLDAFVDLFVQLLMLCGRAGLVDLEHVSLDGSKVEASASKHRAMSYGRMESEVARLEREIREFAVQAELLDAAEDQLYGAGKEAHEIREELRRREARLQRIAKAKEELEDEARRARELELRERAEELRLRAAIEADPTERRRKRTRADRNEEHANRLAVGRGRHGDGREVDAPRQEKTVWRAMREKLSTEQGRQIYSRRKVIAEPVFGQAKEARRFRRFSLRGLAKVQREWTLVCLCSNLLKLVNAPLSCDRVAAEPA